MGIEYFGETPEEKLSICKIYLWEHGKNVLDLGGNDNDILEVLEEELEIALQYEEYEKCEMIKDTIKLFNILDK